MALDHSDPVTGEIIGIALRIHSRLGPGLLESVYETILAHRLALRGRRVERQKPISLEFEGIRFEEAFRADLVVDEKVIVEVKAVPKLAPAHSRQLLTYLRLSGCRIGLLINFGEFHLRDGIRRVVND